MLVKTDIVNNLKKAKKLNLTTEKHAAFLSLVHTMITLSYSLLTKDQVSL